jgi:hypothetical protein
MQRRRRNKGRGAPTEFLFLVIAGVIGWALLHEKLGTASVVLLWISAFTAWLLVAMPTRCGYRVRDLDRGCLLRVHGLARGCWKFHSQLKRDALFEALGLRNPGLRFRKVWNSEQASRPPRIGGPAPAPTPSPVPPGDDQARSAAARKQARYNAQMWVFSFVSAVAGVVMPLVAK